MGFRDVCPRPARSWCEGSSIRVPSPLVTTRHGRAARVGAAATAAAMRGAGVAGEPLRRVDAPTPLLLRSPPLAKVQSHSHHLLRQVLSPYLAVPPRLEELVVIAVLHHSLLNCVVYDPCRPILRLSVGKGSEWHAPGFDFRWRGLPRLRFIDLQQFCTHAWCSTSPQYIRSVRGVLSTTTERAGVVWTVVGAHAGEGRQT